MTSFKAYTALSLTKRQGTPPPGTLVWGKFKDEMDSLIEMNKKIAKLPAARRRKMVAYLTARGEIVIVEEGK